MQAESRKQQLDIPTHLLSSLSGGNVDSSTVREQLALERSLSPSRPGPHTLNASPSTSKPPPPPPPPPPPLPPPLFHNRRGNRRLGSQSFAESAARDMAMRFAFEDIETFPRNQLRATRISERCWKPDASGNSHCLIFA